MPDYLYRRLGGLRPWAWPMGSPPRDPIQDPPRAPMPLDIRRDGRRSAAHTPFSMGSGPLPSSSPYTDSFTDTAGVALASHTPDAGGSWALHSSYSGSILITDANRARSSSALAAAYYYSGVPSSPDYEVSASIVPMPTYTSQTIGVLGRLDPASNTFYGARYNGGTDDWQLYKQTPGGGLQQLGTYSTPGIDTPALLTLRMAGTSIELWVDGILRVRVQDSAITAAGRQGLWVVGSSTNSAGIHLDSFQAGPILTTEPVNSATAPRPLRFLWGAPGNYQIFRGIFDPPIIIPPVFPGVFPEPARKPMRRGVYEALWRPPLDPPPTAPPIPSGAFQPQPGARRMAFLASWIERTVPRDQPPPPPIPGAFPGRIDGPGRRDAYRLGFGRIPDPIVGSDPIFPGILPDRIRILPRTALYWLTGRSPMDQGIDLGPGKGSFPARIEPIPRRAAYPWVWRGPNDFGLNPVLPPIQGFKPDRAHGRSTLYRSSAYWLLVRSPMDQGIIGLQYRIFVNDGLGGPIDYGAYIWQGNSLGWTSSPLAYPGVWKYGVRCYEAATGLEDGNLDAMIELILDSSGADATRRPDPPMGLSAHALDGGQIRVDWIHRATSRLKKPTGFHVYIGIGTVSYASPVATVAYVSDGAFQVDLSGLLDGQAYLLAVRAYNGSGEETNSFSVEATADATAPGQVESLAILAEA